MSTLETKLDFLIFKLQELENTNKILNDKIDLILSKCESHEESSDIEEQEEYKEENEIKDKIDLILSKMELQEKSNEILQNHIIFIENTYEKLRSPLTFVKNSVSRMMGYSNKDDLPIVSQKTLQNVPK